MICHFDKRGEKLKQKVFSLSVLMNQFEGFVNSSDFNRFQEPKLCNVERPALT